MIVVFLLIGFILATIAGGLLKWIINLYLPKDPTKGNILVAVVMIIVFSTSTILIAQYVEFYYEEKLSNNVTELDSIEEKLFYGDSGLATSEANKSKKEGFEPTGTFLSKEISELEKRSTEIIGEINKLVTQVPNLSKAPKQGIWKGEYENYGISFEIQTKNGKLIMKDIYTRNICDERNFYYYSIPYEFEINDGVFNFNDGGYFEFNGKIVSPNSIYGNSRVNVPFCTLNKVWIAHPE